jgi:hypothetical protein
MKSQYGGLKDDAENALKLHNEQRESEGKYKLEGEEAKRFMDRYIEEESKHVAMYDAEGPGLGVYFIPAQKLMTLIDTWQSASDGSYEVEGFGGEKITKYLDNNGIDIMKKIATWRTLYGASGGVPAELSSSFNKLEGQVKKKYGMSEKQKDAHDAVLKEFNKKKPNMVESYLIRKLKGTSAQTGAERVIDELKYINENGGLSNENQMKKYIELFESKGYVNSNDLTQIKTIK